MSLFISNAYANGATQAQGPDMVTQLVMIGVMVALFYFVLWRPQSKRAKEHRELINSLTVGSEVMFAGGLMGRITQLTDEIATIELTRGVEIKVQRASIISVLPEGTVNNV